MGDAFRVVPFKQALHVGAHFAQQLFQAFAVGGLYAQVGADGGEQDFGLHITTI